MRARLGVLVLLLAVIASAVAVVESKHRSRALFVELQQLERSADRLNVEWGRLRLEQGAYATHGRIADIAGDKLDMRMPPPAERVIIRPDNDARASGVPLAGK